jgi:hypothetical protein
MYRFLVGFVCAVAIVTANAMIDGVWIAQLMLFAAGVAAAAAFLVEG